MNHQPIVMNSTKCYYCGKFIGKNDDVESERVHGLFSPDSDRIFHKGCKRETKKIKAALFRHK